MAGAAAARISRRVRPSRRAGTPPHGSTTRWFAAPPGRSRTARRGRPHWPSGPPPVRRAVQSVNWRASTRAAGRDVANPAAPTPTTPRCRAYRRPGNVSCWDRMQPTATSSFPAWGSRAPMNRSISKDGRTISSKKSCGRFSPKAVSPGRRCPGFGRVRGTIGKEPGGAGGGRFMVHPAPSGRRLSAHFRELRASRTTGSGRRRHGPTASVAGRPILASRSR